MSIGHTVSTKQVAIGDDMRALDPAVLSKITMTPRRPHNERDSGHTERGLQALAALPPATDEQAGEITLPTLGLLDTDIKRIADLANLVTEARERFTAAEAALTRAQHEAAGLPHLRAQAGETAARAFGANGHGVELAGDIVTKIDRAELAASALDTLRRVKDREFEAMGEARGALRRETVHAIQAALKRAAERYTMLALEVTRSAAAMQAALRALPQAVQAPLSGDWDSSFIPGLCLPSANAFGGNDRGAVEQNYRAVLLANQHPRFTSHTVAAVGWLHVQLEEAVAPSGMSTAKLLA